MVRQLRQHGGAGRGEASRRAHHAEGIARHGSLPLPRAGLHVGAASAPGVDACSRLRMAFLADRLARLPVAKRMSSRRSADSDHITRRAVRVMPSSIRRRQAPGGAAWCCRAALHHEACRRYRRRRRFVEIVLIDDSPRRASASVFTFRQVLAGPAARCVVWRPDSQSSLSVCRTAARILVRAAAHAGRRRTSSITGVLWPRKLESLLTAWTYRQVRGGSSSQYAISYTRNALRPDREP